jgi:hypothetical protein
MRRVATIAAGAALLALLPFSLSGCNPGISCACASPADPNLTPPPISADQAANSAAKFAGVPSMQAGLGYVLAGRQLYLATATGAVAFVDAVSGVVLEVVLTEQMPDGDAAPIAITDAQTAAEAYLARVGLSTDGMAESARLLHQAGISAYEVDWVEESAVTTPRFQVMVNAATGVVFAFVDQRPQLKLTAPLLGRNRAATLAIAAMAVPGEVVTSADLSFDFGTGAQASSWDVGLGVPMPAQPDVYEHGAYIRVDAVTGEAVIVKS